MKLNLGCGAFRMRDEAGADWWNVDADPTTPADAHYRFPPIDASDESVDEIYCALPDQRVLTPAGHRPISAVRVGDRVLGRSGFTRILETFERTFRGTVCHLKTPSGGPIVTGEHPVATPNGWLHAQQFRNGGVVLQWAPPVEPSEFIHRSDVLGAVTRLAPACALRPVDVVVSKEPLAEGDQDIRLALLPRQVRATPAQHRGHPSGAAVHREAIGGLTPLPLIGIPANRVGHAGGREDRSTPIDDRHVAVHDDDRRLELSRGKKDRHIALAVQDAGQVRPVRLTHIQESVRNNYVGRVHNLRTADGTFFLEGVLTHNCGHVLEHFEPDEAARFLAECRRVLVPGGRLGVVVPNVRKVLAHYLAGDHTEVEVPAGVYWNLDDLEAVNAVFLYSTIQESRHRWGYDAHTLCKALERAGFHVEDAIRPDDPRLSCPQWWDLGYSCRKRERRK